MEMSQLKEPLVHGVDYLDGTQYFSSIASTINSTTASLGDLDEELDRPKVPRTWRYIWPGITASDRKVVVTDKGLGSQCFAKFQGS